MKKLISLLMIAAMAVSLLAGCRRNVPAESTHNGETAHTEPSTAYTEQTEPSAQHTEAEPTGTADTQSARILEKIWAEYAANERFAVYGGTVENSVMDAPGDLDLTNTDEITTKYLLPEDQLANVKEAASLVHLMNNNIFTGVVFQLQNGADLRAVAKALRGNVQQNRWICGQPDRLLIAEVEGQLLMAYGSKENMNTFHSKLKTAYKDADILYDEAITE